MKKVAQPVLDLDQEIQTLLPQSFRSWSCPPRARASCSTGVSAFTSSFCVLIANSLAAAALERSDLQGKPT